MPTTESGIECVTVVETDEGRIEIEPLLERLRVHGHNDAVRLIEELLDLNDFYKRQWDSARRRRWRLFQ